MGTYDDVLRQNDRQSTVPELIAMAILINQ